MKNKWNNILKDRGYKGFYEDYNGDLSLIRKFLEVKCGLETKHIWSILNNFRDYLKRQISNIDDGNFQSVLNELKI